MTKVCRLALLISLSLSTSAFAEEGIRQRWSHEFSPSSVIAPIAAPFLWGVSWNGSDPKNENEDRLFSLGSVKKMITAATALRELGSNFRFSNDFTGELDSSQHILFSPGFDVSGDPTWAHPSYGETLTSRISKLILQLKKQGVKKIVGSIQVNSLRPAVSQFHRPAEWKKSWLLECYAALPSPVSLYGNCAELTISSEKSVYWNTPGVSTPIENKLTASTQNSIVITPVLDHLGRVAKYVISGGFATKVSQAIPVQNNEGWLKNIFIQQLKAEGISYESSEKKFKRSRSLISFREDLSSKTLKEILIPFLQDSINLVGDRLHIEASGDFITLASLIPDPNEYQNAVLLDGSGLIAADQISPKTFLHFLTALKNQPYFQDLYAGLPISGVNGTLENRMNDALLKNRVHAKTGTIDGVANLAGYWVKADQTLEPFVIFTESSLPAATVRAKADSLVGEFARKN